MDSGIPTGPETVGLDPEHTPIEGVEDAEFVKEEAPKRKKLFTLFAAGLILVGGAVYAYEALYASKHITTDNAYVGASIASVTPLVSASVTEVLVGDTEMVRKGDILVRLDNTDAQVALDKAAADLALAKRTVRGLLATDASLDSQITARAADFDRARAMVESAKANLEKAEIDLRRRKALEASGSVSGDEVTQASNARLVAVANLKASQSAEAQAKASYIAAEAQRNANRVMIEGTTVDTNPQVLRAKAAYDQARLDLERTVIRAPLDGVISRRQVQVGQRVQVGATLMDVVPLMDAYVDANFKEGKLTKVKPGQKVTLTSDLYGDDVKYSGVITGFSGGTGAAFSIIPAQNATGNWIKVVQRLPVRIALDKQELENHPLRVGLSMNVDVYVGD